MIYDWIMQTKSHLTDVTMETDRYAEGDKYLFLDMDMAILGASSQRTYVQRCFLTFELALFAV